ncbi:MAG: rhomboid family intramembrane serine protease [Deltaproteobacteria bacterium]|nr:rhomboid family intramembrane serine protease [Deltaproteobacteria bacterium]
MIIPIGLEPNTVRRHPWVTYGLMALCVASFVLTHFAGQRRLAAGLRSLEQAVEFHGRHPYLRLDPRLQRGPPGAGPLPGAPDRGTEGSRAPEFATLEQVELDTLTHSGFDALADLPERRFGLVPARPTAVGFVTHMFLHAGLLHLLGNLLFLYLSAPFLEDVWGRPFFAGFYLVAGVVSGGFFALRYPGLDAPLIGASGAIAGAMGAFFVRHWRRRIRFLYWFGVVFRGTFAAPAWAVLPVYFLRELLSAYSLDVVAPGAGGGGVAYWAHVSGFGFGAATAAALTGFGLEARWLAPSLDSRLTVVDNAGLDRALRLRGEGRTDEAWLLLLREARRAAGEPDATLALWDLARETGREAEAAPLLGRLIQEQVRRGDAVEAYAHWEDLRARAPAAGLPLALEVRLAEALGRDGRREESEGVAQSAAEEAQPDTPVGVLVRLARLAVGPARARVASLALDHPELSPELRVEVTGAAPELPSREPVVHPPAAGPARARPGSAASAIPLSLQGRTLVLDVEGLGRRALDLGRVRSVAGAAVDGEGPEKSWLVLDLLLEAPTAGAKNPSAVRLDTRRFDPRHLVPTEADGRDAFLCLAAAVLLASGAAWLLGEDPRRLARYPSLPAYERALRRALEST